MAHGSMDSMLQRKRFDINSNRRTEAGLREQDLQAESRKQKNSIGCAEHSEAHLSRAMRILWFYMTVASNRQNGSDSLTLLHK